MKVPNVFNNDPAAINIGWDAAHTPIDLNGPGWGIEDIYREILSMTEPLQCVVGKAALLSIDGEYLTGYVSIDSHVLLHLLCTLLARPTAATAALGNRSPGRHIQIIVRPDRYWRFAFPMQMKQRDSVLLSLIDSEAYTLPNTIVEWVKKTVQRAGGAVRIDFSPSGKMRCDITFPVRELIRA